MITKNILLIKNNVEFRLEEVKEFILNNCRDKKCTLVAVDEDLEYLKNMLKDVDHNDLHFANEKSETYINKTDGFGFINCEKYL